MEEVKLWQISNIELSDDDRSEARVSVQLILSKHYALRQDGDVWGIVRAVRAMLMDRRGLIRPETSGACCTFVLT